MLFSLLYGLIQRDASFTRPLLQFAKRSRADLPVGHIDDTFQAQLIMVIEQQTQVGHHILNFFAFVELAAAYDLVGDVCPQKLFFDTARLRVGAIHDSHIAALLYLSPRQQAHDLTGREESLFFLIIGLVHHDLLARAQCRPELLILAQPVTAHHVLSRVEDGLRRAIVLLQHYDLCARKIFFEANHIFRTRSAPAINHLVIVAHDTYIAQTFMPVARAIAKQAYQLILWKVAILELIDMYILPAHLVVVKETGFTPPQLLGKQEQIIKVNAVIGAQQLLIDFVDACRHLFNVFCRLLRHLLRPQQIILGPRDQRLHRGRLILLLIQVQIFYCL